MSLSSRSRYGDVGNNGNNFDGLGNPFSDDHHKYRFDVAAIAIGSMDGAHLKFYEVGICGIASPFTNSS